LNARAILLVSLLEAALAFLAPASAFAFDVDFFVSTYEATVGDEVELRFTVYGVDPGDVTLEVSSAPAELVQSASRKERQRVEDPAATGNGYESATVITQKWIATEGGSVTLGPFAVRVGADSVTVPPVHIAIAEQRSSGHTDLRWKVGQSTAREGDPLRIVLEASVYGEAEAVYCDAPENAILETVPLSSTDGNPDSVVGGTETDAGKGPWSAVAAWNWIPLKTGSQQLPVAVLEYTTPEGESRKAGSPVFAVTVSSGRGTETESGIPRSLKKAFTDLADGADAAGTQGDDGTPAVRDVPLPAEVASIPDKALASAVAELWNGGKYARAISALRHAEHERLFPGSYRQARMASERSLSLSVSQDVPPAAWKQISVIGVALLLAVALLFRLVSLRARSFLGFAYLSLALSLALAIFASTVYIRDRYPAGVSGRSALYHIPETSSTIVERLGEGTPVLVLKTAQDWLYIQTPTSLRGWIPSSRVSIYTGSEKQ
jgi:hypothetical protein